MKTHNGIVEQDSANDNDDGFEWEDLFNNKSYDDSSLLCETVIPKQPEDYTVPILLSLSDSSMVGNGVLIGPYLITAAHVAQSDKRFKEDIQINREELYYSFDGVLYKINDNQIVYDGRGVPDKDGIHDDLIIYRLSNNKRFESFQFNKDELKINSILYIKSYNICKDKLCSKDLLECSVVSKTGKECLESSDEWNNCFTIEALPKLEHGDSGSPVFRDGVLFGIMIRTLRSHEVGHGKSEVVKTDDSPARYTILNARYIQKRICEFEKKQ